MINLELPWPPSVNHYWRSAVVNGRIKTYITPEAKAWRNSARWLIRQQVGAGFELMPGALKVELRLIPPRNSGDIDNFTKGIFDALQGFVFANDSQIKRLEVDWMPACAPGYVRIVVGFLDDTKNHEL